MDCSLIAARSLLAGSGACDRVSLACNPRGYFSSRCSSILLVRTLQQMRAILFAIVAQSGRRWREAKRKTNRKNVCDGEPRARTNAMPNGCSLSSTTTMSTPARCFPSRAQFCLGPTLTSGQQNSFAYSPPSRSTSKPFASALSDKVAASNYGRLSPQRFIAGHRHLSSVLVVPSKESRHADG